MGNVADIVNTSVTTQTSAAKMPGFGVPCIVGAHTRFSDVIREYSSQDGMLSDGFVATDPEYMAAGAMLSQNPRVPKFKVARRALLPTLVSKVTPTAVNSKLYRLLINGTKAEFTSDASATVAEITAGLKTAIDALAPAAWILNHAYALADLVKNDSGKIYKCTTAGTSAGTGGPTGTGTDITDNTAHWQYVGCVPTVVDGTTYITLTAPFAGGYLRVEIDDDPATVGYNGLSQEYTHVDPGIATDLAAIKAASGDWYAFMLTTPGTAEVKAAAAWAESNLRFFAQASPETAIIATVASGATDVAAYLKSLSEFRTAIIYHNDPGEFADAAWLGNRLPTDAGSETWKFTQLSGVSGDKLTDTHIANLKAKNANGFTDYGGTNITFEGTVAAGEFIDIIRGRDWYQADIQTGVFNVLVAQAQAGKTPYTDDGITSIEGAVRASNQRAEARKFLDKGSSYVTVPLIADVSTADRAVRKLTGIVFGGRRAGAVHAADLKGTVTV